MLRSRSGRGRRYETLSLFVPQLAFILCFHSNPFVALVVSTKSLCKGEDSFRTNCSLFC